MRRPVSARSTSRGARGPGPQRVEHLRALDRAPRDTRRELAADRLYLGELGHSLSVRGGYGTNSPCRANTVLSAVAVSPSAPPS